MPTAVQQRFAARLSAPDPLSPPVWAGLFCCETWAAQQRATAPSFGKGSQRFDVHITQSAHATANAMRCTAAVRQDLGLASQRVCRSEVHSLRLPSSDCIIVCDGIPSRPHRVLLDCICFLPALPVSLAWLFTFAASAETDRCLPMILVETTLLPHPFALAWLSPSCPKQGTPVRRKKSSLCGKNNNATQRQY